MNADILPLVLVPLCVAFVASAVIHPLLVRFALAKNLVDNPNIRKLQVRPIPVLGGIGVFFGMMLAMASSCFVADCSQLFVLFGCMVLMLYVGAIDDVLDLSPKIRFAAQLVVVLMLIYVNGLSLDEFHGLWGFYHLPHWAGLALTLFGVVGIINSLNLIDGVDGLFSLFAISAASFFAVLFWHGGDMAHFMLAVALVGAMIPFLLHNAFGYSSKMFVGDGGTLLVGVMMSAFVMKVDCTPVYAELLAPYNVNVVPLLLASLSIPVFDTVRVMTARIIRGTSPFEGDKTHLHHLFIWLGISHMGTTLVIVALNLAVVGLCWLVAGMGASVNVQFAVVVFAAVAFTAGIYYPIRLLYRLIPERMDRARAWKAEHRPSRHLFNFMQKFVDRF